MDLDVRLKLEEFLHTKREEMKMIILQEKEKIVKNPFAWVRSFDDSFLVEQTKLTYELVERIENVRSIISTATVLSGKPKLRRSGHIPIDGLYIVPSLFLRTDSVKISIRTKYSIDKTDLRNLFETTRSHTNNNNDKTQTIPEIIMMILRNGVSAYQFPVHNWDTESGGLISKAIFDGLEDKYEVIETSVVSVVQTQIELMKSMVEKEVSKPNGIRKKFRDKFLKHLETSEDVRNLSAETLQTIFEIDWKELEKMSKFMKRNSADFQFVQLDDIQTTIDLSAIQSVLKS